MSKTMYVFVMCVRVCNADSRSCVSPVSVSVYGRLSLVSTHSAINRRWRRRVETNTNQESDKREVCARVMSLSTYQSRVVCMCVLFFSCPTVHSVSDSLTAAFDPRTHTGTHSRNPTTNNQHMTQTIIICTHLCLCSV